MRFFHIDRKFHLKPGSLLDLYRRPSLANEALGEHLKVYFPEKLSLHGIQYLLNLQRPYRNESTSIELLFEFARHYFFPEKRSRFVSVFACETLEDAIRFRTQYINTPAAIWKVEGTAVHRGDVSNLILNGPLLAVSKRA